MIDAALYTYTGSVVVFLHLFRWRREVAVGAVAAGMFVGVFVCASQNVTET